MFDTATLYYLLQHITFHNTSRHINQNNYLLLEVTVEIKKYKFYTKFWLLYFSRQNCVKNFNPILDETKIFNFFFF